MEITSNKILNEKYVQIYLTDEESEKQSTKEVIEKYKKQKYKVSIFVSGKENYPEILKKIITKQVDLSHHVC